MRKIATAVSAFVLLALPVRAADRLSDHDVKSLVERIDDERGKFEDAMDDSVKHSVRRSATGEIDVKRELDDFDQAIDRLKDRLKPDYSASTEAGAVLKRASAFDVFVKGQPGMKGASEWDRLVTDFTALAAAYGAPFPLPEGAPVRRLGDKEVADTVESLAKTSEQLHKSLEADLKKDLSVDSAARTALLRQVEDWTKNLETLHDRVKDGEPSSAEADRALQGADALKSAIDGHQAPSAKAVWSSRAAAPLKTIAQAYGR